MLQDLRLKAHPLEFHNGCLAIIACNEEQPLPALQRFRVQNACAMRVTASFNTKVVDTT